MNLLYSEVKNAFIMAMFIIGLNSNAFQFKCTEITN